MEGAPASRLERDKREDSTQFTLSHRNDISLEMERAEISTLTVCVYRTEFHAFPYTSRFSLSHYMHFPMHVFFFIAFLPIHFSPWRLSHDMSQCSTFSTTARTVPPPNANSQIFERNEPSWSCGLSCRLKGLWHGPQTIGALPHNGRTRSEFRHWAMVMVTPTAG